jgi:hypothetical protein
MSKNVGAFLADARFKVVGKAGEKGVRKERPYV